MRLTRCVSCVIVLLAATLAAAGQDGYETALPETCSLGWIRDGKTKLYTPLNLYECINGEAELYLPYGFKHLSTAFYREAGSKGAGLVVNVFAMGSSLDAFGIYANYRSPSAHPVNIGVEGFADESQLMFYQSTCFVQIMGSGSPTPNQSAFLSCAASISRILPLGSGRPGELDFLNIPGLVPGSEKYYPEGLLGYKFLGKGLTAEAVSRQGPLRVVVVKAESDKTLEQALNDYRKYLLESGTTVNPANRTGAMALRAVDPLYKGVVFQQSGRYAAGVTGATDSAEAETIVHRLLERLPRY